MIFVNGAANFHNAISERRLAVVNVGNDGEVTDLVVGHRLKLVQD